MRLKLSDLDTALPEELDEEWEVLEIRFKVPLPDLPTLPTPDGVIQ